MKYSKFKENINMKSDVYIYILGVVSILLLVIYIPNSNLNYNLKLYFVSLVGTINYIAIVYSYHRKNKNIINPYIMFISAFFLFQFGQNFLITTFVDYEYYVFSRFRNDIIIDGSIFSAISIIVFNFGAMFSMNRQDSHNSPKSLILIKRESFILTGKILLTTTLIPAYYLAIRNLLTSSRFGYGNLDINYNSSAFLRLCQMLFIPSTIILFCTLNNDDKYSKGIKYIVYFYGILLLFGGGRTEAIAIFLVLISLKYLKNKSVNMKSFIQLLLSFFLISVMITTFGNFRRADNKTIGGFFNEVKNSFVLNPINQTIGEMGYSISPLFMTMEIIPDKINFKYGESYIASIISVIPESIDFSGSISIINKKATLDQWLMDYNNMSFGPGYSIIAEAYYNFGYFGIIIIFLWGIIFGKLLDTRNFNQVNEYRFLLYIKMVSIYSLFTFPRRPTIFFIKQMFFLVVIIYIISFLVEKKAFARYFFKNKR